ncbi:MAG: hypothetical protein AABX54_02835 [Nanoarchaeota archaeon]
MTISFKYKTVKRPDGTNSKTPSIPITLLGTSTRFDSIALIDSGADISAISKDIAEILGINLDGEITSAFGIGGKVDSIESKINIVVEKGHEHYIIEIPVKIILGEYDFPILLGREGFFDNFVISFYQKDQRISLKKINN